MAELIKIYDEPITNIKLFNINEKFIEFKDGCAIDGAIEIHFKDRVFTIGWNFQNESFEFRETPYYELEKSYELVVKEMFSINNLIGKKVNSINLTETEFEFVVDYTMKTEKKKFITGIDLNFGNNFNVRISTSNFDVDFQNKTPINIIPDIQGNLLIDIGRKFEYDNFIKN